MWSRMQENPWAHMLGPLNTPIQSEVVYEVSELKSDPETSIAACDWTGASKGPNDSLAFQIFALRLFISKKTYGFQSRLKSDFHVRFLRGKGIS